MTDTQLQELQAAMLRQAYLFDDPYSYRCGVQDALARVRQVTDGSERGAHRPVTTHATRAS